MHTEDLGSEHSDFLPLTELWQLWPLLEDIKVEGHYKCLERNYDAEFCGIHDEEAMYLRELPDGFLEAVHIVPIQPSLLTMPSECAI